MKILITGGTGLIGSAMLTHWLPKGVEIWIASRSAKKSETPNLFYIKYDGKKIDPSIGNVDVIINFAGAPIGDKTWTSEYKKEILSSRIDATNACKELIANMQVKPKLFISGSAVGYYGTKQTNILDESAAPGTDFLAKTCYQWEKAAENAGVRTVCTRIGIVLSNDGGALPKLVKPFKFYAGGYIGSGEQGFPWIHINDIVGSLDCIIQNENISGAVNLCAPEILNNKQFAKNMGKVLHKSANIGVPSFVISMMMGESSMLVLEGQKVIPKKLTEAGYTFQFPTAELALQDLLGEHK